jgi:hypothetical protein
MDQGDFVQAKPLFEQAQKELARIGMTACFAEQTGNLGRWALLQGDCVRARPCLEESLRLAEEAGARNIASCLDSLGELAFVEGNMSEARSRYSDEFDTARKLDIREPEQQALHGLSLIALRCGDPREARSLLRRCLLVPPRVPRARLPRYFETVAAATIGDDPVGAAEIFGAAEALREAMRMPIPPVQRPFYDDDVARLHQVLDPSELAAAWDLGRSMSTDQVIARAVGGRT